MKLILIIIWGTLMGSEGTQSNYYKYDDQGRPITPSQEELDTLESNGGKLWNRLLFENSPYYCSMRQIQWIGIHGEKMRFRWQRNWINLFFSLLAILHAIGVMSWNMNPLKMMKWHSL